MRKHLLLTRSSRSRNSISSLMASWKKGKSSKGRWKERSCKSKMNQGDKPFSRMSRRGLNSRTLTCPNTKRRRGTRSRPMPKLKQQSRRSSNRNTWLSLRLTKRRSRDLPEKRLKIKSSTSGSTRDRSKRARGSRRSSSKKEKPLSLQHLSLQRGKSWLEKKGKTLKESWSRSSLDNLYSMMLALSKRRSQPLVVVKVPFFLEPWELWVSLDSFCLSSHHKRVKILHQHLLQLKQGWLLNQKSRKLNQPQRPVRRKIRQKLQKSWKLTPIKWKL